MVGLGVPDASQTRTAWRAFSTTFIAGFWMICGKPSGSDFSEKEEFFLILFWVLCDGVNDSENVGESKNYLQIQLAQRWQ